MSVSSSLLQTDLQYSALAAMFRDGSRFIAYTVYGASPVIDAGTLTSFDGIVRDGCLGGYLLGNGYRVYSPMLMRFYSADQVSPFGRGGVNAYAYCQGDPVNYRDDSGRVRKPARKISPSEFELAIVASRAREDTLATVASRAREYTTEISILDAQLEKSRRLLNISSSRGLPSFAEESLRKSMVQLQLRKHKLEKFLISVNEDSAILSQSTSATSSESESQASQPTSPTLALVSLQVRQSSSSSVHHDSGSPSQEKERYFVYPGR
ncbi:RHS repeat-associated core domain-containing protein [Pseudomonas mosselii]|uniref:RHS repeat-associated core domain-containing protein n=1 Tax=Pseudomonas mosselii TaxID=78327 RepID=UPI00339FAA0C